MLSQRIPVRECKPGAGNTRRPRCVPPLTTPRHSIASSVSSGRSRWLTANAILRRDTVSSTEYLRQHLPVARAPGADNAVRVALLHGARSDSTAGVSPHSLGTTAGAARGASSRDNLVAVRAVGLSP